MIQEWRLIFLYNPKGMIDKNNIDSLGLHNIAKNIKRLKKYTMEKLSFSSTINAETMAADSRKQCNLTQCWWHATPTLEIQVITT